MGGATSISFCVPLYTSARLTFILKGTNFHFLRQRSFVLFYKHISSNLLLALMQNYLRGMHLVPYFHALLTFYSPRKGRILQTSLNIMQINTTPGLTMASHDRAYYFWKKFHFSSFLNILLLPLGPDLELNTFI